MVKKLKNGMYRIKVTETILGEEFTHECTERLSSPDIAAAIHKQFERTLEAERDLQEFHFINQLVEEAGYKISSIPLLSTLFAEIINKRDLKDIITDKYSSYEDYVDQTSPFVN